jgi:hypothetical protein
MLAKLQITRLGIVILARNHNPSLLNPDFLKINEIVGSDWEVTSPSFTTETLSQVIYKNGVRIIVQPDQIAFDQLIKDGYSEDKVLLKNVILKYLDVLPHVNYQSIGINPLGHIIFDSQEDLDDYFSNYLLRPGDWKIFSGKQPSLSGTFTYDFEDHEINILMEAVYISEKGNDDDQQLGLLFKGNVNRNFESDMASQDKLKLLIDKVNLWSGDVNSYIALINHCFLNQED